MVPITYRAYRGHLEITASPLASQASSENYCKTQQQTSYINPASLTDTLAAERSSATVLNALGVTNG